MWRSGRATAPCEPLDGNQRCARSSSRGARPLTVPDLPVGPAPAEQAGLERRTRLLAWGGSGWHIIEFAIAVATGLAAGSIALIGFEADSLIETLAGGVVLWLLPAHAAAPAPLAARTAPDRRQLHPDRRVRRGGGAAHPRERRPSSRALGRNRPRRVYRADDAAARPRSSAGSATSSIPSATVKEAAQTQLCAYLSIGLLLGLSANAIVGWWWADPLTAFFIAAVALKEGRESWRGQGCCDAC